MGKPSLAIFTVYQEQSFSTMSGRAPFFSAILQFPLPCISDFSYHLAVLCFSFTLLSRLCSHRHFLRHSNHVVAIVDLLAGVSKISTRVKKDKFLSVSPSSPAFKRRFLFGTWMIPIGIADRRLSIIRCSHRRKRSTLIR